MMNNKDKRRLSLYLTDKQFEFINEKSKEKGLTKNSFLKVVINKLIDSS
jgi:hypothetical protein